MNSITKWNKETNERSLVSSDEFLAHVGSGRKKRKSALLALLDGEVYQDVEIAFYIAPLRELKVSEEATIQTDRGK